MCSPNLYVTGFAKTRHNSAFSNSILFHFYNVHTQVYLLTKFQLRILKVLEVTALQSSSNRNIDLYSVHREKKLQALTKTDVLYEWSKAQTQNLHQCTYHELKNELLGKLFLLLFFITTNKVEIHKETLIANNCFDFTWETAITYNFLGAL